MGGKGGLYMIKDYNLMLELKLFSDFGHFIKTVRQDKGMTIVASARMMDVSVQSLRAWENNISEPTLSNLVKMFIVYDINIDVHNLESFT